MTLHYTSVIGRHLNFGMIMASYLLPGKNVENKPRIL